MKILVSFMIIRVSRRQKTLESISVGVGDAPS